MSDTTALLIATTALYSTGHWIGATVLLSALACIVITEAAARK